MKVLKWLYTRAKNYPKTFTTFIILLLLIGYFVGTRVPSAMSCWKVAVIEQSIPSDKWRHNFWTKQCQYYNGTRFIAIQKVLDVGGGSDADVDADVDGDSLSQ